MTTMHASVSNFADECFAAVQGYIGRCLAPIRSRVDAIEQRSAERGLVGKDGRDGVNGIDGEPGAKGTDGRDGRDGEAGRDAALIEPLATINSERSYPRGTWAKHAGGLWLARTTTDGMSGWDCIVDGIAEITSISADDPRHFAIRLSTTSGKVLELPFFMPTPVWRGVWSEREFEHGDLVTYDGSIWHCERATKAKPGTQTSAPDWKLCTKKGRDGKDGEKGVKGDRGDDGRPGRDLTSMNLDGSKF